MKYGMYECEKAAEDEARRKADDAARIELRQAREDRDAEEARELARNPFDGVHWSVNCDACGQQPIRGLRWKCQSCDNFDVCGACFGRFLETGPAAHHHDLSEFIQMPRVSPTHSQRNKGRMNNRITRTRGATRGGATRGGGGAESDDEEPAVAAVAAVPPPPPRLRDDIETGFDVVKALEFFLPGFEQYGSVTKHDAVCVEFYEKVKTRLQHGGRCPVTSGHVRIPFGLTIDGRIPSTGVALGAKAIGGHAPARTCHMSHMREGLFMEYLDTYHGIPEMAFAVRKDGVRAGFAVDSNLWLMETLNHDTYTMKHFTEHSKIIPDTTDVQKLIAKAVDLIHPERETLLRAGASEDAVDEVTVVAQHDVRTRFDAGTDHAQYATMAATGVLFPHVPGYDIAAIIPVTLRVQVLVGACDICSSTTKHMTRLCANKHEMCVDCVREWRDKQGHTCPFCRAPLLDGADGGSAMECTAREQDPFGLGKPRTSMYVVPM